MTSMNYKEHPYTLEAKWCIDQSVESDQETTESFYIECENEHAQVDIGIFKLKVADRCYYRERDK